MSSDNNQKGLDKTIKLAYEKFMRCISDNTKSVDELNECLHDIFLSLSELDVDSDSSIGQKISTFKSLISQRIISTDSPEDEKTEHSDYTGLFADLGARFIQSPSKKFNDIKGMEEIKKILRIGVIYPFIYKELSKEFEVNASNGVLLYGPPGNGKTFLSEAIAGEAGLKFIEINPAYLYNEYFGRYEKNISNLFRLVRETSPNVLFLDEVESLIPKRETTDQSAVKRGVTQLLIEINKLMAENMGETVIIAATNLPWEIDPAMLRPGRFDLRIYVSLPSYNDRLEIIKNQLKKGYYSSSVDPKVIAENTNGFSIADLVYLFKRATQHAFFRAVESGTKTSIENDDIINQIGLVRRDYSNDLLRKYAKFQSQ